MVDKNGEDLPSQTAAQSELESDSTEPNNLDADDGKACEDFDYGATTDDEADDHQYNSKGKEVTVIVETIPDQKVLVAAGGPGFITMGAVVALGLVGLGIHLIRRT